MRVLGVLVGVLFGLFFAGGGFAIFSQTALPMWQDWSAMQSWQLAEARLLSVTGHDNDTDARYRYTVSGVAHHGHRVYVASFKDNIGSYHSDMYDRLNRHRRADEVIAIWVNPQEHSKAIIDRDMRWGLFALTSGFCLIFVFIGLSVCYFSIRSNRAGAELNRPSLNALRAEWDEKRNDPSFKDSFLQYSRYRSEELTRAGWETAETVDWRSREGWGSQKILSEAKSGLKKIWFFAAVWNVVSSPLIFVLPEEFEKGNHIALVGWLFPLIGVFLLYKAVASTLEYRQFGQVPLEMDPFPGAIGGHVGGRVQVSRLAFKTATDPSSQLSVRLECVNSYMSGSGDSRSRREDIKWAEQGQPQIEIAGSGVKLAFRFDVPDNLPEADVEQTDAYHFWRLTVKANIKGVDLDRQYNVPVFATGASSRYVRHDVSAQVLERKEQESVAAKQSIALGDFDIRGLSRAMRVSGGEDDICMAFPMFRNKVLSVFAGIFAGGFGFAAYSMIETAAEGGVFGIVSGLFSVPFALVALVAAVAAIYMPFNNLRVRIHRDQVTVLRRLLFVPIFYRQLSRGDISALDIKRSGSTGQGVDKIEHFKVFARDKRGKSITLAEDLDGEDVASHFRDYLAQRLMVDSAREESRQES